MVGVGITINVGFKYKVGVFNRLGRERCYVGKKNEKKNLHVLTGPPYVWPVAIHPW